MGSKPNKIFLVWQDPKERSWHTVGRLTQEQDLFVFDYTQGAKNDSFIPFSGMEKLDITYKSDKLFPLFANRLLSERRPEYKMLLSWLGLSEDNKSPLQVLAKTGGVKSTDNLQIFPEVAPSQNNRFEIDFFVHGVRYISDSARQRIKELKAGDQLFFMKDIQNPVDRLALAIRTGDTPEIVGYCPRFLAHGLSDLTMDNHAELSLSVAKVNQDAPLYYQLMCKLKVCSNKAVTMFNGKEFQTISGESSAYH